MFRTARSIPPSRDDSAKGSIRGESLSAGYIITTTLAILVALGITIVDGQVNACMGVPVSRTVAVFVLSWFAAKSVAAAALQEQHKVAAGSLVWTSSRVVRTSSQIALTFLLGLGLTGLIWGHTISFVTVIVAGIAIFDIRPRFPSREQFWSLLEYARYSWLGGISA